MKRPNRLRVRRQAKALTLVEAMVATLILATAAVAATHAIAAGHMQVYDAAHRAAAIELAEAMMDEVLRLPYNDPGGNVESGRSQYDNLADYNGFSESRGQITDLSGAAYDGKYQVFSRSVTVVPASRTVSGLGAAFAGLNITVTVQNAAGSVWTVQQFVPQPVG
jgi:hypothetical protein